MSITDLSIDGLKEAIEPLSSFHAYASGVTTELPRYVVEDADNSVRFQLEGSDVVFIITALDGHDWIIGYVYLANSGDGYIAPEVANNANPEVIDDNWTHVTSWVEAISYLADLAVKIAQDKSPENLELALDSALKTKSLIASI